MARKSYRKPLTRMSVQVDDNTVADLDTLARLFQVSTAEMARQVMRMGLYHIKDVILDTPSADAIDLRTNAGDASQVTSWVNDHAN